jgi:hypothetical protein
MIRSGIIVGVLAVVVFSITGILVGLCEPIEAMIMGLAAGVLAAILDKPGNGKQASLRGGVAGLIASLFSVIGGIAGYLIRTYLVMPSDPSRSLEEQLLGIEQAGGTTTINVSHFVSISCCSVTDVILFAGLGALGGFVWYKVKGDSVKTPTQALD